MSFLLSLSLSLYYNKKKCVENKIYMLCNHRDVPQETLEHTRGQRQEEI